MAEPSAQAQTPSSRQVSAGNGVEWWTSAWKLLFNRGATGVWIGMWIIVFILFLVLHWILHWIPFVGWAVTHIGWIVVFGGLMLASRKTDQGTPPAVGDMFAGFGSALGSLVITAVLLMVAELVIFGILFVAGAGALFGALSGTTSVMTIFGASSALLLLVGLVLLIPVAMASWLAPALIVLRQQAPVSALKASLAACWGNLGALTIYGLLWIGFAIIASIPIGLGWLILAPLTILSTYTAYRDLFEPEQATAS